METTISEKIGHFLSNLSYDKLPQEVVEKAKRCMTFGIGMGISCHSTDIACMAREVIKSEESGVSSGKGATIFCDGSRVTTSGAAFANAALFHARTQEDTLGTCHNGTVTIPAVLALAESGGHTGREVIEAIVAGYEIAGCLEQVLTPHTSPRGFRASSIYGIFGSTSASSKLLGLTEDETVSAIGLAAAFASGTIECFAAGTMEWRFEVGVASREGIVAALLAQQGAKSARTSVEGPAGFMNAFANTIEGSESIASNLGNEWLIMKVAFKPYPICMFNQTPVRTALSLMKENGLCYDDIEKVEIRGNDYEYHYPGISYRGPFSSIVQTLMSTSFCVALAIVDNELTLAGLCRFEDPKINELIKKIEHVPDETLPDYCCAISIQTRGGNTFSRESKEGPDYYNFNMEQTCEVVTRATSETGVSQGKVREMIEIIMNLDQEPDIRKLTELLASCP